MAVSAGWVALVSWVGFLSLLFSLYLARCEEGSLASRYDGVSHGRMLGDCATRQAV